MRAFVSWPAKMMMPRTLLVLRRQDPRSRMEAGVMASVPDLAPWSRWSTRFPVKVYSEALGCSQWISPCAHFARYCQSAFPSGMLTSCACHASHHSTVAFPS